jgi:hypothetical protein
VALGNLLPLHRLDLREERLCLYLFVERYLTIEIHHDFTALALSVVSATPMRRGYSA